MIDDILDFREQSARIDRMRKEADQFMAEQQKLSAEQMKLPAERVKRDVKRLKRVSRWSAIVALIGSVAANITLILIALGRV